MAKNTRLIDKDGVVCYPLTTTSRVINPVTGKTIKEDIDAFGEKAANAEKAAKLANASAAEAESLYGGILRAMQNLPDGSSVSAQVAVNTSKISEFEDIIKGENIEKLYEVEFGSSSSVSIKNLDFTLEAGEEYILSLSKSNGYTNAKVSVTLSTDGTAITERPFIDIALNGDISLKYTPSVSCGYLRLYCPTGKVILAISKITETRSDGLIKRIDNIEQEINYLNESGGSVAGIEIYEAAEDGLMIIDDKRRIGVKISPDGISVSNLLTFRNV